MKKKYEKQDIIAFFLILGAVFFVLLKCIISPESALYDESNYIATAFRFYKGDAILVDDWSPWQLSGWITMPFVYVYMWVVKSTDGIVLYFRILYVLMKLLVCFYAVYKLRKADNEEVGRNKYVYLGMGLFFCFSSFNIDSLSYNTISIAMVLLISITILAECDGKWDYFLCGLFLAVAVLSIPFLIFFYVLWGGVCIIYACKNQGKEKLIPALEIRNFGWLTLGASALAFVFVVFLLSRAGIEEVFRNLPYIISEPDHNMGEGNALVNLLAKVWLVIKIFLREYIVVTILNIIYIGVIFIAKWKKKECMTLAGAVICLVISCMWIVLRKSTFMQNAFFIPFVWFAIEEILIGGKIRIAEILSLGTALFFPVCMAMGTNTAMFATSASFNVIAVLSFIILGRRIKERQLIRKQEIIEEGIIVCGISLLVVCTLIMHIMIVWLDVFRFSDFNNYISKGPLKGTFTQEEVFRTYENILDVMDMVEYKEDDNLFCGTMTPVACLYKNVKLASYSTLFFSLDYDRLEKYFNLHPNKTPTIVYYEVFKDRDRKSSFYKEVEKNYEVQLAGDSMIAKIYKK